MARCDMCFKEKPGLQPPMPKFPSKVCKGCFYEIDRVVGFLQHYGFVLQGTLGGDTLEDTKPPKKATKKESSTTAPEPD